MDPFGSEGAEASPSRSAKDWIRRKGPRGIVRRAFQTVGNRIGIATFFTGGEKNMASSIFLSSLPFFVWKWVRKAIENPVWVDTAYLNSGFVHPSETFSTPPLPNTPPSSANAGSVSECHYRIEEMTIGDYDGAIALWKNTEHIGLSDADRRNHLAFFLQRNPRLSLVAKAPDGSIVGTLLCGHDGRRGYIYHLAVSPPCRRRGIGRALVDTCRSRLHALGISKCHTFVFSRNPKGLRFWRSLGWRERKDLRVMSQETASSSPFSPERGDGPFSSE
jgi:ribosomal protein S18 acetylase RimI-like enzyme